MPSALLSILGTVISRKLCPCLRSNRRASDFSLSIGVAPAVGAGVPLLGRRGQRRVGWVTGPQETNARRAAGLAPLCSEDSGGKPRRSPTPRVTLLPAYNP